MTNILIGYYSHSGNTRKLAQAIARGVKQAGAAVNCQSVVQIRIKSLFHYDAIILGSPTYYGQMAAPMKLFIDKSVKLHGRLAGKIAGAFTTSGGTHCGAENLPAVVAQRPFNPRDDHYRRCVKPALWTGRGRRTEPGGIKCGTALRPTHCPPDDEAGRSLTIGIFSSLLFV